MSLACSFTCWPGPCVSSETACLPRDSALCALPHAMDGWCSLPHQPDALEMVCSRLVCAFMTTPDTLWSAVRERERLPRGFSSSPSSSRLHRAGPSTQLQLCPRGTSCQQRPLRTDTVRPVGLLCGSCTARLSRYRSAFLAAACLRSSARCRESCSTADENDSFSTRSKLQRRCRAFFAFAR